MSGNSHQRKISQKAQERLEQKVTDAVVERLSNPTKGSTRKISTDRLTNIIAITLGVVLSFVGYTEIFPLQVNLAVYFVGLGCILVGGWKWETAVTWRLRSKIGIGLSAAMFYCGLVVYPVYRQYQREIAITITFKDSPEFTWWRRQVITHDFAKVRDYLVGLGIEPPKEFPPLGIQDTGGIASHNPPGLPLYRTEQLIGKDQVQDRMMVTSIYVGVAIWDFLARNSEGVVSIDDAARLLQMQLMFSSYFNASFWNKATKPVVPWMFVPLWEMRRELGADFTDKLVTYTIRSIADNPTEGSDPDIRIYLSRKLKIADSIIENDMSEWPQIARLLKDDGISTNKL